MCGCFLAWPLRSITHYEVAEAKVELVPPRLLRGKWSPAGSSMNPLPWGQ